MTGYTAQFEPAMRQALAEARRAQPEQASPEQAPSRQAPPEQHAADEVPVGAVVLDQAGTILARARNRTQTDGDPTAHAEILAIRQAARTLGGWRLTGLTLVVTLEPCTMCAGAITLARLSRLVYGAEDPKAGAVGSLWDVLRDRRLNHQPEVIGGVLAQECGAVLREFFAERRRPG